MTDATMAGGGRGVHQPRVGSFNQAVILDQIRRSGGLSRTELAAVTGLSAQTVSNVCQRLIDAGIVEEGQRRAANGPGKPRIPLTLVGSSRYAIGVHLDPGVLSMVLLGIDGQVVAQRRRETPSANDPARTMRLITQEIEQLIAQSGVDRTRIAGVGIAAPGPIDVARGVVVDPPNLTGWHRVPLRDSLANSTGFAVILDKDVTAAAVAERWVSPTPRRNFAFLYIGTGLGVGLVVNDEVVRGGSGNAGEIGHIMVDPEGSECVCGLRGCIAVSCTPLSMVQEAEAVGVFDESSRDRDAHTIDLRVAELAALAARGFVPAQQILERAAERVARALAVVCNVLDVDHVILGGPYWDHVEPVFSRRVPEVLTTLRVTRALRRVDVTGTRLGSGVGAIGAACLVLDEAMTPRTTSLLLG